MDRIIGLAAAAALVLCSAAAFAQDVKKSAGKKQSLRDIKAECWKQNGGWYDEATKSWVIKNIPYYHMGGKADAINNCIAQRTGKRGSYVREQTYRP